jgi:hypothetical protein
MIFGTCELFIHSVVKAQLFFCKVFDDIGFLPLHCQQAGEWREDYTGHTRNNGVVSKVNEKFISHPTWEQHTLSAAATVHISHALQEVRFSCLLRGCGTSFQDGVAAGEGFLCAPF